MGRYKLKFNNVFPSPTKEARPRVEIGELRIRIITNVHMDPTNFGLFNCVIAPPLDRVDDGYLTYSNQELFPDAMVI